MDKIIFQVEKENTGIRIDKYLSDNMENISRSYLDFDFLSFRKKEK